MINVALLILFNLSHFDNHYKITFFTDTFVYNNMSDTNSEPIVPSSSHWKFSSHIAQPTTRSRIPKQNHFDRKLTVKPDSWVTEPNQKLEIKVSTNS